MALRTSLAYGGPDDRAAPHTDALLFVGMRTPWVPRWVVEVSL